MQLIIRLERPPLWARAQFDADPIFQAGLVEDGNSTGPPDDPADFGAFVTAIVERYDGDGNADRARTRRRCVSSRSGMNRT
ncbi:MAG: hypothetical protein HC822_17605 [Oscillochloris sp.]|nr:hypothetical protein [Oscillochloris sp.]